MYRIAAIAIQLVFYGFYLAKFFLQQKQQIRTNQMGKGNKPQRVLQTERLLSLATVLALIADVGSVLFGRGMTPVPVAALGFLCGVAGIVFFAAATITMKNSWRVGIPEEKTALVTGGIYRISRNPAFVGFDLLYLSVCLVYPNVWVLLCTLFAAVMLHRQILLEEEHLLRVFGQPYADYMQTVRRYMGRR